MKTKYKKDKPEEGISVVEFTLVAPVLFFLTFAIIDGARYFQAQIETQNALAYAIKRAEAEYDTVVEFDKIKSNSVDYQKFNAARDAIVSDAEKKLSGMKKSLKFFNVQGVDDLQDTTQMQSPRLVAYILPGTASYFIDPDKAKAEPELIQNRNVCRKTFTGAPSGGSKEEFSASTGKSCPKGVYRTTQSYKALTNHYPLELVAKAKFNGILLRNASITARAAGYLPLVVDGAVDVEPTPTVAPTLVPTRVPTSAPTQTPTFTPSPRPTSTRTPLPTYTATMVSTIAPTRTALPTYTRTAVPTSTHTALPTNTRTIAPTSTQTPLPTGTRTTAPTSTQTAVPTYTRTSVPTSTQRRTPVPTAAATRRVYGRSTPSPRPTKDGGHC